MYTLDNTINDLLKDDFISTYIDLIFPKVFIEMVPDDMRDIAIGELENKLTMPWGIPYMSEGIVVSANIMLDLRDNDKYGFVQLWNENPKEGYFPVPNNDKNDVSLILFNDSFKDNRPIALIVPGGAYESVAISNEGMLTAEALEKKGYAVAILNYRTAPNRYPLPQIDMTLAIKYLRSNGKALGANGNEILSVGFSAGGHLVACQSLYSDEYDEMLMRELDANYPLLAKKYSKLHAKSNKVCLSYPVTTFMGECHRPSFDNLSGGDESLLDKMCLDLHATRAYPKTFIWHCMDDSLVPYSNSVKLHQALSRVGVDTKLMLYPTGDHGIATAEGTSAKGWVNSMVEYMRA